MNPCLSTNASTVTGVLSWAYQVHDDINLHTCNPALELRDSGSTSFHDRKLESALIQTIVKRELFPHLSDLVGFLYSADEAFARAVHIHLLAKTGIRRESIMWEMEKFKDMQGVGEHPSKTARVLQEWHGFALDILTAVFTERGILS